MGFPLLQQQRSIHSPRERIKQENSIGKRSPSRRHGFSIWNTPGRTGPSPVRPVRQNAWPVPDFLKISDRSEIFINKAHMLISCSIGCNYSLNCSHESGLTVSLEICRERVFFNKKLKVVHWIALLCAELTVKFQWTLKRDRFLA